MIIWVLSTQGKEIIFKLGNNAFKGCVRKMLLSEFNSWLDTKMTMVNYENWRREQGSEGEGLHNPNGIKDKENLIMMEVAINTRRPMAVSVQTNLKCICMIQES